MICTGTATRSTSPRPATCPSPHRRPTVTQAAGTRRPARARTGRRSTAEHHHPGGDHGRDLAGRRDDRDDPRHAWPGGTCCPPSTTWTRATPRARCWCPACAASASRWSPRCWPIPRRQAKAGAGYDRAASPSTSTPARPPARKARKAPVEPGHPTRHRRHRDQVRGGSCRHCPVREPCTRSTSPKVGRQLTVPPREIHHAQLAARAAQDTPDTPGLQARYARRAAGVEGTIRQGLAVTGMRRARYRGLPKTQLEHAFAAISTQPDPPGRLLERTPAGPHQDQPPYPARTRTGRLIKLASRVIS